MTERERSDLVHPGMMLLSAAIFGYFGFGTQWNHYGLQGQFLLFVAMLEWTMKLSAVLFLFSFGIALANAFTGSLVYSVVGLVSAVMFVVVAVLDIRDQQHMAMSPLLLLVFAGWNGYWSWVGLRGLMLQRPRPPDMSESRFP